MTSRTERSDYQRPTWAGLLPLRLAASWCASIVLVSLGRAATPADAPAVPRTQTVMLADFDNQTGESAFDHSLQQALMLELGQSPFLSILSDRRVGEILRTLGRPIEEPITPEVGREICVRSNSQALLQGTITRTGGRYRLDLTAQDCRTGKSAAASHGEAIDQAEVLAALNRTSLSLRAELGESEDSVRKYGRAIAATTSLEALASYATGAAVKSAKGDVPSIPYFKQAIALDPGLPLAYAAMAVIYRNLRQPSLALEYATGAYQRRDRVSEKEQLHLAATYFLVTREVDREIGIYERWKSIYPDDFVPHNNLGNDYVALGQLQKALAEYQVAVRLVPSVIAYTNVVGVQIGLNRLDDAQATFDEAFASKLDGGYLHQNLYWLAFLRGDAGQMARQLAWGEGRPGDEDALLSIQSDTEACAGRLRDARLLSRRAVQSAVHAGSTETAALWQVNAALRDAEAGDADGAKREIAAASALSSGRDVELMSAFALARAGDSGRAAALASQLERRYSTDTLLKVYWLPVIHAAIEMNGARSGQALKYLKTAEPYELGTGGTFISYLYPAYLRGQAYLQARNPGAAAIEFRKMQEHSGIVSNFITGALARLQLGRALAMAGDAYGAKAAYEHFFGLWKNADIDSPVLKRAKAEYRDIK